MNFFDGPTAKRPYAEQHKDVLSFRGQRIFIAAKKPALVASRMHVAFTQSPIG